MYSKWYSIVVGLILAVVGLDPWFHTGPQMVLMPTIGIAAIVIGIIGIISGAMDMKCCKKKEVSSSPLTK